jgi:hypothetical protein
MGKARPCTCSVRAVACNLTCDTIGGLKGERLADLLVLLVG